MQISTCQDVLKLEEQRELKFIEQSCKLGNKQWTVSYPWKRDPAQLPDNHVVVQKSWKALKPD